jgi:signal transduction histidine kinase
MAQIQQSSAGILPYAARALAAAQDRLVRARFGSFAHFACLFVGCVSVLVLGGWVLNVERLKTFLYPNPVAMNPLTAICFLLGAVCLWIKRDEAASISAARRHAATACAALMIVAAILVLLWQIGIWDSHVDEWLFRSQLASRSRHNRMAPNTALSFLLMGMALLWLDRETAHGRRPAQILTLVTLFVALLAVIGYLLAVLALYHVGPDMVPMALNTAICFTALSLGTLCARLDREPMATIVSATAGGVMARRLLPAAFIIPLLLGWMRLQGERAGAFGPEAGVSLFALGNITAFNLLVWWNARLLYRIDEHRRVAEQRLAEQNELLRQAVEAEREARRALQEAQSQLVASEKLAGLGQMVAGVAHEINNPLAFVANNVAVLQRDIAAVRELLPMFQEAVSRATPVLERDHADLLAQLRDRCEQVDLPYTLAALPDLLSRSREGLKRIQKIVEGLRNFARLDESDYHEVDLNPGIESTVEFLRARASDRGVRIELDLAPLNPLACHPAKINQLVMNLVANAIDASEHGDAVTVRTAEHGDAVRIDVIDHGHGIDPAIRPRIFDPFFTTKPIGQGTGLGLSIAYGIVKVHAGTIDVQSDVGKGSNFIVRLPRANPSPERQRRAS